jgi:prolyl oligopeptidase
MRITVLVSAIMLAAVAAAEPADPFLWLEDVHGERAMQWVRTENAKTHATLDRDPRYQPLFEQAKLIAEAKDRIPLPSMLGGQIFNFWQDADHVHGIWRKTTLLEYQSPTPQWQTVLDLDDLSAAEHANWFWKGENCSEPLERRCMVYLSDGGEDAVTPREFDLGEQHFVAQGFSLPSGKQDLAWEDEDTLLVSREWKPGEVTKSGYPFVVKRIKRGQALDQAVEVFRGAPDDVGVVPATLVDGAGHRAVIISRNVSFFESRLYLLGPQGPVPLALARKLDLVGLLGGRLIVSLNEDWTPGPIRFPAGSLVSMDLAALAADPQHPQATLVYSPGPREAFVGALVTQGHLLVHVLDDVNGRAFAYTPEPDARWTKRRLALGENASLDLIGADTHSERAFMRVTGFLTPPSLILADLGEETLLTVKTLPAKFDASKDVVEQFAARSKDGTRIPYFIVHPIGMKLDGNTPTIMNAYGGFQAPQTPQYSADLGKLWLERGGAFVLANIRGGGEFGPAWHEAGLKTHRQRIYDDFAAVAQDLIAKGFTSPAHLGIRGGSNGGLLMGVEFTQHPQMWGAVDIQVPLLDMLRYERIAAGSSWVAEYGSVANPTEKAFLASISPYTHLKAGVRYPRALIWSTTKDDRVGPQHARKFAAKLSSLGVPYYYYEVTEGGHGSAATPVEHAEMAAREYAYFGAQLGLP